MWRSRQPFNQPVTSERSERLALTFSTDIKQMHSIKMGLFCHRYIRQIPMATKHHSKSHSSQSDGGGFTAGHN